MVRARTILQKANSNYKEVYDNFKILIIPITLNGSIITIKKCWKKNTISIYNINHNSRMNNIFFIIIKINFPRHIWVIKCPYYLFSKHLISPDTFGEF